MSGQTPEPPVPIEDPDDFHHDSVPLRPVPADTLSQWPPGTFLENLAPAPGGGWLVSVPSHRRIDRVDSTGAHEPFAALTHHPTGIVADGDGALVLSGTIGVPDWQLVRVRPGGAAQPVCELPELRFGNGMRRAGDRLLATDSARGLVLAIDPAAGTSTVWLAHPRLTGPSPDIPMPGANGIAVRDGWVYLSNTGRGLLLRCPLDSPDPAADLQVVARRLAADDFAVHPGGRIFLATHYLNSVLQLDPDGRRLDIAGPEQGAAGATAVALDPADPATLFVTTTGGMVGLDDTTAGPARARLLRLATP